jgi:hypothetical protein
MPFDVITTCILNQTSYRIPQRISERREDFFAAGESLHAELRGSLINNNRQISQSVENI